MGSIEIDGVGSVAIVRFKNGISNAVSSAFVDDLSDVLQQTKKEFSGLVLAGGNKFFSIGLNLPELLTFDRTDMSDFLFRFNQTVCDLYTHPMPTAAVINGHALAAGTIFAVAADFRYVCAGRKLMGLNEVKLGIPVPYIAVLMLSQIVRNQAALDLIYQGEFIEPKQAMSIGMINGICEPDKVEDHALDKIKEIAALPAQALIATKACKTEHIRIQYEKHRQPHQEAFLDCWFMDSTQELLKKASETF